MKFEEAFGHVRGVCAQTPSMEALTELENVLWSVWDQDSGRVAAQMLPYVLEALASWPAHLRLHELPGDATLQGIPLLAFLERAFESDVCVCSDFLQEYLMGHRCRLALSTPIGDKVEVPTGLTRSNHFDYPIEPARPSHAVLRGLYTKDRETQQLQYQLIQKFLVRYLLTYELNAQEWETLHTQFVAQGSWRHMATFGEVEPQHGLMPSELAFIERTLGWTFPRVVRDFYRLFGRLVHHGPGDRAINPYDYVINALLHNETFLLFAQSNHGKWMWGYRRSETEDPAMVLFRSDDPRLSSRQIQTDRGGGFLRKSAYAYQTHLSDFVSTLRDPQHTA